MFASFPWILALGSLLFATAIRAQKGPTVGSPTLYQCTAASFQYTCDSTPCIITIRPAGQPTESIKQFDAHEDKAGRVSWTPAKSIKAGAKVTAYITNADGVENYSAELVINKSDVSCDRAESGGEERNDREDRDDSNEDEGTNGRNHAHTEDRTLTSSTSESARPTASRGSNDQNQSRSDNETSKKLVGTVLIPATKADLECLSLNSANPRPTQSAPPGSGAALVSVRQVCR
ncbi:hypothetical protein ACM66B_001226 [Microbotryomycetes sp. NB124-2]